MKKIVYLYSQIMPYQTIVYKVLSNKGCEVHGFENDSHILTPFIKPNINGVFYYKKSDFTKKTLLNKVKEINPDILVVCGWNEPYYTYVAKYFRKNTKIPVVCPIDSQYLGTLKQKIGFLIAPFYIKKMFSHIWVPGVRQYHFAKMLGYDNQHIIMNSLTADTELFSSSKIEEIKGISYPKKILFVGRYNEVKGLDLLLKAWNMITEEKKGWSLTLVGNGPLKEKLLQNKDIEVFDFQTQEKLKEIAENSGVFILPSIYEPWALVLQEFASAGLPIVCSDTCGASPHFVINGYNGFSFKTGDVQDLKKCLLKIFSLDNKALLQMSINSRKLSNFVTPEMSASSLLGLL